MSEFPPGPLVPSVPRVYEAATGLDPFQILTAEHALLRLQLTRVLEAARQAPAARARDALASLLEVYELHERREDQAMVPVCERLFGGRDGAASVLRDDHEAIRSAFHALSAQRAGVALSVASLERLRLLLEDHFAKEERVLFPLILAHLEGREAADLARRLRFAETA